ncbi:DUF2852 domain-containing protein [Roseicyclus sp.]|uniref:DUF2852 domain-containing protein n=1 Tax=Roseicyclus sp. TaxID=1914329 RepID=UPI003F6CCCC4
MASTLTATSTRVGGGNWFSRSEAWLDEKGKGAWIAAMVLAFILFWPAGLALLAYMIWSKRMFSTSCKKRHDIAFDQAINRSTGNAAFDAYKADTLRRLQEEQDAFEAFLHRLREAKDKAEFDQFLQDRADTRKAATAPDTVAT